jgi:hypothetical protein
LEYDSVNGRIRLKWFKGRTRNWAEFIWLRTGNKGGSSEHGVITCLNKPFNVTSAGGIWFLGSCLNPNLFYVSGYVKSGTILRCI